VTRSTGKAHSPQADAIAGYVIELARSSAVWRFEAFATVPADSFSLAW
jgi:hypothetical protein